MLNSQMAGVRVAQAVLASVDKKWPGSYERAIELQSHWPVTAMFGIHEKIVNSDFYNHVSTNNLFFDTEEEMMTWVNAASYPVGFEVSIKVYAWDLGPEYLRTAHYC